jgi:hypothetical protein
MTTVAIARTTAAYALLFSRLSSREAPRGQVGLTRVERSTTQQQKRCEEERDDGKRPLAEFHGSTPFGLQNNESGTRSPVVIEL